MARESHKENIFYLAVLILFCLLEMELGPFQPVQSAEKDPEIRMGEVSTRLREIESTPPLKILEVQIEILNKSQKSAAPSHSITVIVTPKEVTFSSIQPGVRWNPPPQEISLDLPLPPSRKRALMIGYPIREEPLESILFEVQINPPEGEKKTVKWEKR